VSVAPAPVPPQVSALDLLDAMDGVCYLADTAGTILAAGRQNWPLHAERHESGWLRVENVVGRVLFDVISGDEVAAAYRAMHERVAGGLVPEISFSHRCDSPTIERHMRMSISAVRSQGRIAAILYQSQILEEIRRPPMFIFSPDALVRSGQQVREHDILHLCSYCHDVAWPIGQHAADGEWIRPGEYYARGGAEPAHVSHGICPRCRASIVDAAE
jgi:hypothetical protein